MYRLIIDWSPTIVAIISIIFSWLSMNKKFKNSIKEKIYSDKRHLYIEILKFINSLDQELNEAIILNDEIKDVNKKAINLMSELQLYVDDSIVEDFNSLVREIIYKYIHFHLNAKNELMENEKKIPQLKKKFLNELKQDLNI